MVWLVFSLIIFFFMALDLGVLNKSDTSLTTGEAIRNSIIWVSIGILFGVFVYYAYEFQWFGIGTRIGQAQSGSQAFTQYLSGYIVELSLSVDNLFVFALVFNYFKVPVSSQHRVLFWGIVIALILRGLVIFGGIALVHRYHWIEYLFALIILYSAYKMWKSGDGDEIDIENMGLVKILRKYIRMIPQFRGDLFFVRENSSWHMTPLFLTFMVVNVADVVFAFDSIPAIFAITKDEFIVFSSNIFAILGLRSLYFLLIGMMERFKHLKTAMIVILLFIGIKMLINDFYNIHSGLALLIILVILGAGIFSSMYSEGNIET